MMWCMCWQAGADSRDLGARDKRTRMVSHHTRPPARLWKTRADTVQITGHYRSNPLEHKELVIRQLPRTVLYNATFTTVAYPR